FSILYTRTSSAIRTKTLSHVQNEFQKNNIPSFRTHLHEREAFRALFSFGGSLETLDPGQVGGLENAIANAREYAAEFVHMIQPADKGVANHGGASRIVRRKSRPVTEHAPHAGEGRTAAARSGARGCRR